MTEKSLILRHGIKYKHSHMCDLAEDWPDTEFVQAVLAQLPWYHQRTLLDKLRPANMRLIEGAA